MTSVQIKVNGRTFHDYTDVHVSYGLDQFARQFNVGFTDKWLNDPIALFPFTEGDPITIGIDDETVIDGFIDDIPLEYDGQTQRMAITGRSWNAHLVDASAVHKTGSWRNADLLTISNDVASPFGVTCKVPTGVILDEVLQPFPRWAIESEETAYDCISRAAKMRGIFLTSDAGRNVILERATKTNRALTVLKRGTAVGNILRGTRQSRYTERYSEYIVKSQMAGDDTWYAENATSKLFHRVRDPQITAYRPLVIVSDGQGTKADLELRAAWELNIRAGRGRTVTYEVQGSQRPVEGGLWQQNQLVTVDDPKFDIKGELLIANVSIRHANGGTTTSLELVNPLAYDLLMPPKPAVKKRGGWGK